MRAEELTKNIIEHLERKENKDECYIVEKKYNGRSYSINDVINEIKNQTEFDKEMESNIIGLAIDLLVRDKEEINV